MMWTWLAVVVLAGTSTALTRDQLYTFGPSVDSQLPQGPDVSSAEIQLKVPVNFYGETYESIFVNNGGVLTFRAEIPSFLNAEFPLPYPSIAAFYTNIDTTMSGAVFYRETNDARSLSKAEESVQSNFHEYFDFQPSSIFIATWADVTYSNPSTNLKNTFQISIISNGSDSFVELLYPERGIQWIQKETLPDQLPEAKAQSGFVAEDGRMYTLRGSGSHQIRNIMSWSNVRQPGKYVFRVGKLPYDKNIVLPDQYNPFDFDEDQATCAVSGSSVCHIEARCIDYDAGICCQCNDGFYGNGKSCIKDNVPLRLHGKLNGIINSVSLNDVDIQAYVVVDDGRSYTALSQGPPTIGGSLQLLNVLGDVVGWLFAKPIGNTKNGYQLTGSTFNHTADVFFPETGDRVTVTQEYLGHDVFDQISLESDIRGTLPFVAVEDKLSLFEYEEQISVVDSGVIRADSTYLFTNKRTGQQYEQKVSQTFNFHSCKYAPRGEDIETPITLKSSKNYLNYEPKHNVVRYSMMTKTVPFSDEDPCIKGRSECGPLSSCVVNGDSFRCVCYPGYTNAYQQESGPCVDIDECAVGTHNCDANAECINQEGGFTCYCKEGYEGNGVRCSAVTKCKNEECDTNAQCLRSFGEESSCVCNPGFTGDGKRCWEIDSSSCEVLHNCNTNADCVPSLTYSYVCRCREGFVGDGYYCAEEDEGQEGQEGPMPPTPPYNESDYNGKFILPSCDYENQCTCPESYTSFEDDRGNNLCRREEYEPLPQTNYNASAPCVSDNDCPPTATCLFGNCMCIEGYEGNGYECVERLEHACNCGPKATCLFTATRQSVCVCDNGYHMENDECRPNFICTNNSDCEYNAECKIDSITNEYICQCIEGFKKDQNDACIADGAICNGALCAEHASCLYDATIGLDYCHCDEGYEGEAIVRCSPKGNDDTCEVRNNCSPDATCTDMGNTFACVCREGFIGDGYNCIAELDCRSNPYMCDMHASCLKRNGVYTCECNSGYFGNGSSCAINPRQAGNFLVASDGVFIYRVPFQLLNRENAVPINSAIDQIAVGLDVDCQTGKIYWGDVGANSIKSAAYDGSGFDVFLNKEVKSPEGIAIDWAARNIFWTDPKKMSIEVANLDSRLRKVLFQHDGISNPRGIAVHPQRGKIFWSDWKRGSPKIEWANMDGSERGIFLKAPDVSVPNSLTIDWANDRLCYTDAGLQSIECVGIDNGRKETIARNCSYPFDLAVHEDKFYWTDWKSIKIEYINTQTQERGQLPISTASRKLFGVATAPEQCAGYTNVCQFRNGNCPTDEICLPNGRGSRTCVPGY